MADLNKQVEHSQVKAILDMEYTIIAELVDIKVGTMANIKVGTMVEFLNDGYHQHGFQSQLLLGSDHHGDRDDDHLFFQILLLL